MLVGAACFLAGAFTLTVAANAWRLGMIQRMSTGSRASDLMVLFGALVAVILGYILLRHAADQQLTQRKRMAPDALTLMAKDPRAPILYLRSFVDDKLDGSSQDNSYVLSGLQGGLFAALLHSLPGAVRSPEERLAKMMRRYGPFIAVSDPAEQLPELGAARLSLQTHEWQSVVTNLMKRSRLIVIRPGSSRGLWWEIERVLRSVPSDRVVFWLPGPARGRRDPRAVYRELNRVLGGILPEQLKWTAAKPFLCFSAKWKNPTFKRMPDLLLTRRH
jgi:hypothetical protein